MGSPLLAQQTPPVQGRPSSRTILIDHFGKLIEDKQGSETIKWISKGLQLRIDSTNIYADSAVIYNEDRVYAYGNVVIQQGDSLNVFTDTLYYSKQTDIADLIGDVALEQGSKQLWTTHLTYHLTDRYGAYSNGGTLVDGSLQVTSRRGRYFARSEEIFFRDSVVVLHPRFTLAADSMKYLSSASTVVFTGPTNIYMEGSEIYCESGYYNLITEIAEFNRNAQYGGKDKKATADTIRYHSGTGEVEMYGQVYVEEKGKRIEGDSLRYLERTGETWIYGQPARYADSTRTIISPEIFYNESTNQVSTRGPGVIQDGDVFLRADHTEFDQVTGVGMATGHVLWSDTAQHLGVMADTVSYKKEDDYVLAYGATRPVFYSVIEGDTLYIGADTLNLWRIIDTVAVYGEVDTLYTTDTLRMMRAYRDVRLFKSDMQGRADSLSFHGRDSTFTFYGLPVLWSDTTQFSADTITMRLKNSRISDITLIRRSIIISELMGTYYDQIKGREIIAYFDSNAIRDMYVTGNAESIYYTRDDAGAFIGVNQTICSKMYFTFEDRRIRLLKYFGENSSSMMPMGGTTHSTLRLEGFLWRPDERPHHVADLLK